jgi:hypothetical protein
MGNNPVAEGREGVPQTLSEEVLEKLKEILPGCKKMREISSKISITLKKCLNPAKNSLRTSMPHLHPSPVWKFIMCP